MWTSAPEAVATSLPSGESAMALLVSGATKRAFPRRAIAPAGRGAPPSGRGFTGGRAVTRLGARSRQGSARERRTMVPLPQFPGPGARGTAAEEALPVGAEGHMPGPIPPLDLGKYKSAASVLQ